MNKSEAHHDPKGYDKPPQVNGKLKNEPTAIVPGRLSHSSMKRLLGAGKTDKGATECAVATMKPNSKSFLDLPIQEDQGSPRKEGAVC